MSKPGNSVVVFNKQQIALFNRQWDFFVEVPVDGTGWELFYDMHSALRGLLISWANEEKTLIDVCRDSASQYGGMNVLETIAGTKTALFETLSECVQKGGA